MLGNITAGSEVIGNLAGDERRYFLKDHLGSVRTTVDRNGNVVGRDDYYPFGLAMPWRSSNSSNPNDDYKFTGYELDDEAGLTMYHANARGYDPVLGRFMQVDPMSDLFPHVSSYAYGNNNPLRFTDPTGMAPEDGCPPCGGFEYYTRALFQGYDNTYMGDLLRADAHGQLEQKVGQDLKDAGNATVDATAELADNVSDASTIVAAGGIVAAPFTGGSSLAVTGYALSAGAVADVTSLGLKTVDYATFDGTSEAVFDQGATMILRGASGALVKSLSSKIVVRTGARITGSAFRSASTGQFVTNRFGQTVTAATDATRVGFNTVIPTQGYYNFLLNKKN